jgi:hypothetical protein
MYCLYLYCWFSSSELKIFRIFWVKEFGRNRKFCRRNSLLEMQRADADFPTRVRVQMQFWKLHFQVFYEMFKHSKTLLNYSTTMEHYKLNDNGVFTVFNYKLQVSWTILFFSSWKIAFWLAH